MINFHIKLGIFQTIFYGLLYLMAFTDAVTDDGKKLMPIMVIVFYCVSMIFTCIVPLIKLIYEKKY